MLGQTTAVFVSFPTFFTSQFATTCALALALGQARGAFARAAHARLGVALLALRERSKRGSVLHGLAFGSAVVAEGRATVRHAGGHGLRVHQARPAKLRRRLARPACCVVVRLLDQRRARNALCNGRHGGDVAAGGGAHALAAGDAVGRVDAAHGQRVRVRARLGQGAGHGARVAVLRGRADVDGFLRVVESAGDVW